MARYFETYKKEFIDKAIEFNGVLYPITVKISFIDNNGKIKETAEYAYISNDSIFEKVQKKEAVNIDNCYIDNFSFSNFRKKYNIDSKEYIKIYGFSAINSFFDVTENNFDLIDFTNIHFVDNTVDFSNSVFTKAKLSFEASKFDNKALFVYTTFDNGNICFNNVKFSKDEVSFKNTIFNKGTKSFDDVDFGGGLVSFINTEFNEGDVSFVNTNFGVGKTSFKVARFGKGKIDFTRTNFNTGEATFEKAQFGDGGINFRSAQFGHGKIDFTRSNFGKGQVSFVNTIFGNGNVSFTGSNFGDGKKTFKLAEFGNGKIDFHYSKFGKGDVVFERTIFKHGEIDFRAVEFGDGKLSFNRATFGDGGLIFEASEKKGGIVSFRRTIFGNGIFNFDMANFENVKLTIEEVNFGTGKVSFKQSKFLELSLRASQINNYFDLRVDKCEKLDLSETIVKDIIDLSPHDYDTRISEIDLSGMRLLGRLYIHWIDSDLKNIIHSQNSSNRSKSEQFRILKENYFSIGEYAFEDAAYVEFKRLEAKADLKDAIKRNKNNKYWAHIAYWLQKILFDKMGLYATNPVRVLISMFFAYLFFVLLYAILPFIMDTDIISGTGAILSQTEKAFYHSGITFLTIGYGDFYPHGIIRWLSNVEGFIGLFMMSYFTVAFVRKILR